MSMDPKPIPNKRRRIARMTALGVDAVQIAIVPILFPGSPCSWSDPPHERFPAFLAKEWSQAA